MAGLPLPLRKPARKPPRLRLTAPVTREHPLHRAIAHALSLEIAPPGRIWRETTWWSVDLASYGGEMPATHIARGCIPGVLDIIILHRGRAHWLEVKAADGRVSDHQQAMAATVIGAGGHVGVVRDAAEAIRCLDSWGVPRRRRTAL